MRIDPIAPIPRRATLLAAAADFSSKVDWLHVPSEGFEWESLAESVTGTWPAATGGSVAMTEPRRVNGTAFPNGGPAKPFRVYSHEGQDHDVSDAARYERYARESLAAVVPDAIEGVLWTGNVRGVAAQTGIVDLTVADHVLVDSGTNELVPTIWALGDQIRLVSGLKGRFTIHSPEAVFAVAAREGLIERHDNPDGGIVWMFGGEHPWVFGAGYTNVGPESTAATAGNVWLAVTGPVEYALDPKVYVNPYMASRLNQLRVNAQQTAFVRFDTSNVWCAQAQIGS